MGTMSLLLAFGLLFGAPEQAAPELFDLTFHTEMRFGNEPGGRSSGGSKPIVKGQSLRERREPSFEIAGSPRTTTPRAQRCSRAG